MPIVLVSHGIQQKAWERHTALICWWNFFTPSAQYLITNVTEGGCPLIILVFGTRCWQQVEIYLDVTFCVIIQWLLSCAFSFRTEIAAIFSFPFQMGALIDYSTHFQICLPYFSAISACLLFYHHEFLRFPVAVWPIGKEGVAWKFSSNLTNRGGLMANSE